MQRACEGVTTEERKDKLEAPPIDCQCEGETAEGHCQER